MVRIELLIGGTGGKAGSEDLASNGYSYLAYDFQFRLDKSE